MVAITTIWILDNSYSVHWDPNIIGMNLNGHWNVRQHNYFLVHVVGIEEAGYTTKWMGAKKVSQELLLDVAFVERLATIEEIALQDVLCSHIMFENCV